MMARPRLWFSLLLALCSAVALFSTCAAAEKSDVVTLTINNYMDFIDAEKLALVEFYAPWCGHCKALAPHYEKAATELKELGIKLAKIDCEDQKDICNQAAVEGYPTIRVIRDSRIAGDYPGARTEEAIVAYMKKQLEPAVTELDSKTHKEFQAKDRVVAIGYFKTDSGEEYIQFTKAANDLRDHYTFGVMIDPKVDSKYGVESPAVVVYKHQDDEKEMFPGDIMPDADFTATDIAAFVKTAAIALIDEVGPENYNTYVASGLPLSFIFFEDEEQREKLSAEFRPLAKEFRGKINFVTIDASRFPTQAGFLALKEQWPCMAIQETEGVKYPFDQSKELTAANVRPFLEAYVKGELKPTIKSEEAPETNDEPVKVVVADEFEKWVMDEDKDVFIEFYAPWCGHCKQLASVWQQLAETAKGDHIVIAKMDATLNDVPPGHGIQVAGFPTLYFVRAGDNKVIEHSGQRTLEALQQFVKDNAARPVEFVDQDEVQDDKSADQDGHVHDEL